jgi:hypothetical protein
VQIAFDALRDDARVRMVAFGAAQKRRNQQRLLHHLTEHRKAFVVL